MNVSGSAVRAPATVVACRVAGSNRTRRLEIDEVADLEMASRWRSGMRRIDCVEMTRRGREWSCTFVGVGHRLPVRRSISLRVALGLAQLGVPVVLREEASAW